MRTTSLFLRALALGLAFVSLSQSRGVAQEPSQCVYCDTIPTTGTSYETITLPGFPNCTITFFVAWYRCRNTVTLTFPKVYWSTPTGGAPCSTFVARLYNGGTTIDWNFVGWIFDEGYHIIAQKYFDIEYAAVAPWNKFNYECPNHGYTTYNGVYESCVDWVYYDDPIHQITRVEKQPCSTQVCCLLKSTFCYNTTTHQDEETDTWIQSPSPAPDCSLSNPPLPPGALMHSGCRIFCGDINHN